METNSTAQNNCKTLIVKITSKHFFYRLCLYAIFIFCLIDLTSPYSFLTDILSFLQSITFINYNCNYRTKVLGNMLQLSHVSFTTIPERKSITSSRNSVNSISYRNNLFISLQLLIIDLN